MFRSMLFALFKHLMLTFILSLEMKYFTTQSINFDDTQKNKEKMSNKTMIY